MKAEPGWEQEASLREARNRGGIQQLSACFMCFFVPSVPLE